MDRILVKDRIKVLNDRSKNLASRNYDSILVSKQKLRLLLKLFVSFNDFPFLVKKGRYIDLIEVEKVCLEVLTLF